MSAWISILHAAGGDVDTGMSYLPFWRPNNGIGRGQPIIDAPQDGTELSVIITAVDSAQVSMEVCKDNLVGNYTMAVSPDDPLTFAGDDMTATFANDPSLGGAVTLNCPNWNIYSVTVQLSPQNGGLSNYAAPVATDLPMALVDDFASFYIKVSNVPQDHSGTLSALASIGGSDVTIDSVPLTQLDDTTWRSAKNLVLIPHDADVSEMATQDTDDFQVLRWPSSDPLDWFQGGGIMEVRFVADTGDSSHANAAVQTHGMAVMSLDADTQRGQGIDLEKNICAPFRDMGYTMWSDAKAVKSKILSDYLIGKQIWYSMTHGESPQPFLKFGGLLCAQDKLELITVADLTPLYLNYRLAILDGCLSAQTDESSQEMAENSDDIWPIPTALAAAFGPNAAVTGWGLTMTPSGAHTWSSAFVRNLKGGSTVQEAYDKFQADHASTPAAKLFKLHVNGRDNIVDIKAKPGATR